MIKSFKDAETEDFFNGSSQRRFKAFERPAYRKLKYLIAAHELNDLRVPSRNHGRYGASFRAVFRHDS